MTELINKKTMCLTQKYTEDVLSKIYGVYTFFTGYNISRFTLGLHKNC